MSEEHSEEGLGDEQERLARELADELRQLKVEDVLIQTLIHISSIGYRRLGLTEETEEDRDLEQSRLAIETLKAVTPVLEQVVPAELIRDFNSSVANLQLAYVQAASGDVKTTGDETPPHAEEESAEEQGSEEKQEAPRQEEEEREDEEEEKE